MAYRLICVVGMVETHGMHLHETLEAAQIEGNEWLGDQEHMVDQQCEEEDTNEATTYPTYYDVEDTEKDNKIVYRSNGEIPPENAP